MRAVFLAASLACASAVPISLRGVGPDKALKKDNEKLDKILEEAEDKDKKKSPKLLNPVKTDERGPRGHFYYATKCEDCFYKGDGCGCEPAVEYFACLTKHCHGSDSPFFADKCTSLGNNCSADLNIKCRGADTVCESRFSQLPTGGLGFSLDVDEDDAFCGPNGKCIGELGLAVHLQKQEKKAAPKVAPAPTVGAPSAAPPVHEVAAPAKEDSSKIWLECGLAKSDSADIDESSDWNLCQKQVTGDSAKCMVPMFKQLQAGANKKAYCMLTEGKNGKRLTSPQWTQVINVHKAASAAVAEKKAEKKVVKKEKKAEKKAVKEEKEEEKKVAKEEKKEDKVVFGDDDGSKLPWMVDKEKRAAARKAKAAEEAKEPPKKEKEEPKKEKAAPKPVKGDDSQLPWMQGKVNDKAPPPHQAVLSAN